MVDLKDYDRLLSVVADFAGSNVGSFTGTKKRVGITKTILGVVLHSLEQEVKKTQDSWVKKVKKKLSNPLPDKYAHKKRPRNRLFPYKVSGELYENIVSDIYAVKENYYTFKFTSFIEFESLHSILTNEGITKGDKSNGRWVGWMDDLLHSEDKVRGGIPSIHKLLTELFESKKLNKIISREMKKKVHQPTLDLF